MAMIAYKCPEIQVVVVDINQARIDAWNQMGGCELPIYEPGLEEVVQAARGRNLFFSSDTHKHVAEGDIIFVRRAPARGAPSGLQRLQQQRGLPGRPGLRGVEQATGGSEVTCGCPATRTSVLGSQKKICLPGAAACAEGALARSTAGPAAATQPGPGQLCEATSPRKLGARRGRGRNGRFTRCRGMASTAALAPAPFLLGAPTLRRPCPRRRAGSAQAPEPLRHRAQREHADQDARRGRRQGGRPDVLGGRGAHDRLRVNHQQDRGREVHRAREDGRGDREGARAPIAPPRPRAGAWGSRESLRTGEPARRRGPACEQRAAAKGGGSSA